MTAIFVFMLYAFIVRCIALFSLFFVILRCVVILTVLIVLTSGSSSFQTFPTWHSLLLSMFHLLRFFGYAFFYQYS